jgi:NhaP-type Na+/H+ or K+/H+ antiporter
MIRKTTAILVAIVFSSIFLLGAIPLQQQGPLSVIPWWGWLAIIAVVLLILFIVVMRMDWNSAPKQRDDEK